LRILVIDDEQLSGAALVRQLERLGHDPVLALHPEDALALAARVDCVITDVEMPSMTGIELARQLRRRDAGLPIAFATGSALSDADIAAIDAIGPILPKVPHGEELKLVLLELGRRRATATHVQRSPVRGHNHSISHRGRSFHVQTEDSGVKHPHIFTHVFYGGLVIATRKTDYAGGAAEAEVKQLMAAQHKAMLQDLRRGLFDGTILRVLGRPI
jgi:CheY-like chemotaxis protein